MIPRNSSSRLCSILLGCVVFGLGCPGKKRTCTPNESQSCVCPDGQRSEQRCNATGSFFGACVCPPDLGGGRIKCLANLDCPAAFICLERTGLCGCDSDTACPGGLYCNGFTGECIPGGGCTSDLDCAAGQYCHREAGFASCLTRRNFCDACAEDRECGLSSDRCIADDVTPNRFCGVACATDADCPPLASCQTRDTVQTCWPLTDSCTTYPDCIPDSGTPCATDADCTSEAGQICDLGVGVCVAALPTCSFGQICDAATSECVPPCTSDADCTDACATTNCRCMESVCRSGTCRSNADCPGALVCQIDLAGIRGVCSDGCTSDAECPFGERCLDQGSKQVCSSGCVAQADCDPAANCVGGQCVTGCQITGVCELCELCVDAGLPQRQCQGSAAQYCQACTPPTQVGACWQNVGIPPEPDSWCCNLPAATTSTWGIPCESSGCPSGFECISIGALADNCFPIGDTCADPNCN